MNRAFRFPAWCSASALVVLGSAFLMLVGAGPALGQTEAKYVGSAACKDCHDKQVAQFDAGAHGRAEKDGAVVAKVVGCESCHGPASLHVAAGGNADDPGFKTVRNFKKFPADKVLEICGSCHKGGDQFYAQHSVHTRNNVSCVDCHDIHHAKNEKTTRLLAADNTNALCLKCHTDKRAQIARSAHMPVKEGGMTCADCHNPHGSPAPGMLKAASGNDLCLSCHADKRGPFLWEHAPVRENCMSCHEPHGSSNPRMLNARQPRLCQRCHIYNRHPSTLYDQPELTSRSSRPINRACLNCHSMIHGSNHPSGKTFVK
ncbi:MAG: DmsE family decaheme c-type cytochrome [Candidatus Eisenbacteria bacterium]|nr:DmsE family decaheme c-type cytochrome [Candidatus Eisenbacteria bacterium]